MANKKLIIGTRASRLALLQCYQATTEIQDISKTKHGELIDSQFTLIKTTGDEKQGTKEAANLNKHAWVDNIEEALINKSINIAIHSGKDIPQGIAPQTKLIPLGKRNNPFDVFVGRQTENGRIQFSDLKEDAKIGTASLRRRLFLNKAHPSFNIVPHRGNVTTRIDKLDSQNKLCGIILAGAGINRLNINCDYNEIPSEIIVPSALQGTLVAQIRSDDSVTESIISRIIDPNTQTCFLIERGISEFLGADCKSCVGIYARIKGNDIHILVTAIEPQTGETASFSEHFDTQLFETEGFLDLLNGNRTFLKIKKIMGV